MASQSCFNCGGSSHISAKCPSKPKYSRCPVCDNVCFDEKGHKHFCPNTAFRSLFVKDDIDLAPEISDFIEVEIKSVTKVVLNLQQGEKVINEKPIYLRNSGMQVRRENDAIILSSPDPGKCTIAVMDKAGHRRMKLKLSDFLSVNEYYSLY